MAQAKGWQQFVPATPASQKSRRAAAALQIYTCVHVNLTDAACSLSKMQCHLAMAPQPVLSFLDGPTKSEMRDFLSTGRILVGADALDKTVEGDTQE